MSRFSFSTLLLVLPRSALFSPVSSPFASISDLPDVSLRLSTFTSLLLKASSNPFNELLRGKYGVMTFPFFTLIWPSRSQSRKYLARVSSSLRSRSWDLKSSSCIHSGTGFLLLCANACFRSESLGISGYNLARESLYALAFSLLSTVFISALAFRLALLSTALCLC